MVKEGLSPSIEKKRDKRRIKEDRVCGLTPDDSIADPGTIRSLAAKAPWPLAGYTKQSWANIMWRLRCALEIGGVKVHRQRRNFKLNGEWEMLIAPPSRRDRDEVHRFAGRSEEHTSELQSLIRISYAVFCLKKKQQQTNNEEPDK